MNSRKVIAQNVRTLQIECRGRPAVANTLQIPEIAFARHVFGQKAELFDFSQRGQVSGGVETRHVQSPDMPRKTVEGAMLPRQDLRPVRHVFVAKRSRADSVNHRAAPFPVGRFVIDKERSAVSIPPEYPASTGAGRNAAAAWPEMPVPARQRAT
jgi:hypothetical protein